MRALTVDKKRKQEAVALLQNPVALGWALGYTDLREELHGKWMKAMLTSKKDMTLQAHRGSYKTTCLCIVIAILMIWQRKSNIIFMRKTDGDVAEVVENVERILRSNVMRDIYRALTGAELQIIKSNSSEITTSAYMAPKGSSQLVGIGIGGSITGKHADIVITDDICNAKDRISRAERERTKMTYQEVQNIKNRGGRIINTGTPWHKEDVFTLMPPPFKYDYRRTGLISDEEIEDLRRKMTPSLFAANYELVHIASENALFTTPPVFTNDQSLLRDGRAHIDAAYGGEDWTAFTCCKKNGDKLYMYGRIWQRHVDTVLDVCVNEARRLMCSPIWCEDNGVKGFLAKEIRLKGMKSVTYHENENKNLKISTYLRKWWDNIVWLDGTDDEYINQIMDYTEDAEHDDAPDSASVLCRMFDNKRGTPYQSVFGG